MKRRRVEKIIVNALPQWTMIEQIFLMGLISEQSSIRKAFTTPVIDPITKVQIIKLIFDFQKLPDDLRRFQPPKYYNVDEEGNVLPKMDKDGRILIVFHKEWDIAINCYSADEELPYETTEVWYNIFTNNYTMYFSSFDHRHHHQIHHNTLSDVLKHLDFANSHYCI